MFVFRASQTEGPERLRFRIHWYIWPRSNMGWVMIGMTTMVDVPRKNIIMLIHHQTWQEDWWQ